jgi:hypothetical protein
MIYKNESFDLITFNCCIRPGTADAVVKGEKRLNALKRNGIHTHECIYIYIYIHVYTVTKGHFTSFFPLPFARGYVLVGNVFLALRFYARVYVHTYYTQHVQYGDNKFV